MNIRDVAISGAKKICGSGECTCGFDCGHSNKVPAALPKVGTETGFALWQNMRLSLSQFRTHLGLR